MAEKPHYITPIEYGGGIKQEPTVIQAAGPRVKNGDWLALTLTTSDATGSVEIRGRILTDAGEIVPFQQIMTFSGTGTQTAIVARLGGGWLQGFSVHRVSGTLTDGEVVAAVHLGTGEGVTAAYECCLASGEVTDIRSLGMGAYLIRTSSVLTAEMPAMVADIASNPAAGADKTWTVTASEAWEIYNVLGQLATSATVANRQVYVKIDDGTTVIQNLFYNLNQTASTTVTYNACAIGSATTALAGGSYNYDLPRIILKAGWRIGFTTLNIQAADQWSGLALTYRKYV